MIPFQQILTHAVKSGASDIHLTVGSPPAIRISGTIEFIGDESLSPRDTLGFVDEVLNPKQKEQFLKTGDFDVAHSISGLGRFRVNILRQRGSVGMVLRHVRGKILNFDELNLPVALEKISDMRRGLVLVTGTTSSGKSTTLAAVIDRINRTRSEHIVTLEDPIEFLHRNIKAIVTQREILLDTLDFHTALRAAMREDPDVILIGEMRDRETFAAAMAAAETGHMVFSTLHTTNVMLTMDRILDMFPADQHEQIRSQLALQLRAVVSQRLLKRADGQGRIPAVEVMLNTPAIAQLMRDNMLKQIPNAIAGGKEEGMQTFNMCLVELCRKGFISKEEAMYSSDNPEELNMNLQGIYLSQGRGGILRK